MRNLTVSRQHPMTHALTRQCLILAALLLAVAATALPSHAAMAGGMARITARYDLNGTPSPGDEGRIHIRGDNFQPNARYRVVVSDISQGGGIVTRSETLMVTANARGSFAVFTTPGYCPRVVAIVASNKRSGQSVLGELRNSDCPW